ncbi:hypothetical protein EKO04_006061 [Ascochyta lentis]|uniref:Uncharacterized protein n=1 Tax=Ascochyta lentis TaxID=205686 RepID=A0A8H7MGS8_9PLEO|nr:hypothetical protein EKO04_006061 [Ascochyta lentis]
MAHTTRRSSFVSSRNDENAYSDVEDPNWDQLEPSSVLSDDDSNNIAENEVSSLTLDTKQELLTIPLPRTREERKTAEMMARSPRFNYSKELDSCLA